MGRNYKLLTMLRLLSSLLLLLVLVVNIQAAPSPGDGCVEMATGEVKCSKCIGHFRCKRMAAPPPECCTFDSSGKGTCCDGLCQRSKNNQTEKTWWWQL